jgi:hypothetical protein
LEGEGQWKEDRNGRPKGGAMSHLHVAVWMKEEKEKDDFLGKEYIGFPFT